MPKFQNHPKLYSYICIWVIFSFGFSAYAQSQINVIISSEIHQEEKIKKIDSLLVYHKNTKNDSLPYYYHDYAYWLYDINKKKESLHYEKLAVNLSEINNITDTLFLQKSNYSLGFYLKKNNQLFESLEVYKKVIDFNNTSKYAIKAYNQLALEYLKVQDFYKSMAYFEIVASLLKDKENELRFLRNTYINLSYISLKINTENSYIKGINFAKAADSISLLTPTKPKTTYLIKLNLAQLYNRDNNLDIEKSLAYYNQALYIVKKEKDTTKIRDINYGKGTLFNEINPQKSLAFLNKALSLTKKKDSFGSYLCYLGLGLTYNYNKDFSISIQNSKKALHALIDGPLNDSILINTDHKEHLLHVIPQLAETHLKYYESTKNKDHLEKSFEYFNIADRVIDLIKINSTEYKSKLFWRKLSADVYGKAIKVCFLKNDIERAYYFMEKNKALLLMEDKAKQEFRKGLTIDSKTLEEEKKLKKQLLSIDFEIKNNRKLDAATIEALKKNRVDYTLKLTNLQDSLFSSENSFNYNFQLISLQEVQSKLNPDEIIVEYHISLDDGYGIYSNNENGYALFITKDEVSFFEITNLSSFKKDFSEFISLSKSPFKSNVDINKFNTLSYSIYDRLFPSDKIKAAIQNKELTIIPDNYLSLLPFEALSTSTEKTSYLIKDAEIHYLYSNSFHNNYGKQKTKSTTFLAMAPIEFKDSSLFQLMNSKKEIEVLENYFPGISYIDQDASKENFIKELPNHHIIHLATHANSENNDSPWITFYNEKITLEELYLTQNNASLVVLSGCNTTLGKLETGEGVMSLARGFFYSGTQSVVSSLWSIDDVSTSYIMNEFYQNLSERQTKSTALRNAKLNYLENHSLSEASPHYWASFILLGENDAIINSSINWWLYSIILILLIFVFFYLIKKRRTF